ncbi:MAG: TonB-dependent receptor [Acidobacteria bacterium]|nr:TonB-dependent receptor [Acidobacteriota bacterium]
MRKTIILGILLSGLAGSASAQTSTGGLRGFVKDDTGAVLVGVTVEASSPARIGGAAVEVTDAQGLYTFQNLPIGEYIVTFLLQGFSGIRRENIRVEVGRTIQVDVALKVGAVEQAVTVTGESPVVDAVHAGMSTNFNQEMLQNIPSARQSYFDIVTFAPAVKINQVPNDSRFIVYGSSSDQNQFQYDGVDISAVSNGGVWDFPSPDIMLEVQVKAVGASAEFHDFQGGVVNIVTKSGSNNFRGQGALYVIPSGGVGNNTPNERFPYKIHYNQQASFELGGPITRNRVWFYGILPANRGLTTGVGVDPKIDKAGGKSYKPFAKGTVRMSEHGNLGVGWNTNMFCCGATASRTAPLITQTVEHGHNPVVYSQYTHTIGAATLIEVRGGGIYIRDNFTPYSDDFKTSGRSDQGTGFSSVNGQNASKQFHNRTSFDASLAHSTGRIPTGTHDFKGGVQTAFAAQRTVAARIDGVSYTDLNGALYQATFSDPTVTGGRIRSAGGYVQDNWTVNGRLALNLGVRFDRTRGDVPEMSSEATIQGIRGASFTPAVVSYPAVADIIRFTTVSARAGFTVRLDDSGRSIFKSSYGRYHGKLATAMFNGMSPGGAVTVTRQFNPATREYDIPISRTAPANFGVAADLENQYTDQVFAGLEQQIAGSMGVNFSFVYKKEGNFIRLKDVGGTYANRPIVDTFRGATQTITVQTLTSGAASRRFQVTNRNDLDQSFKSVVVELNKRFSKAWQAIGSYTWQDSQAFGSGVVTGSTQQDFSSLSPTAGFGRDPNDLINAFGPTATNSTHSVKVSTTYAAPLGIQTGLRYSYESGRPYGRLIIVRGMGAGQGDVTILAEPRGTYSMEPVNDLQVRLDKDVAFGGSQRLRLSMDIFNIFNTGTVLTVRNNSSQTGEALFGQTNTVVRPRTFQLGIRYQF